MNGRTILAVLFFLGMTADTIGQSTPPVRDLGDVIRSVLRKQPDTTRHPAKHRYALLPSFGYNPSFGFVIGAKMSGGMHRGNPATTHLSTFAIEALYTSKGIITLQAIHNVFTDGNRLNFQGNWQVSRFGQLDYGPGSGSGRSAGDGFVVNEYPVTDADSAFPMKYTYIRLNEKVYKNFRPHWYAGAGLSLNFYSSISDEKLQAGYQTPHQAYSINNGFNPRHYTVNGLLACLQYNTREHPVRSYGGIYADFALRYNPRWLGSTKASFQLQYDFRKYWQLGKRTDGAVLAVWHWASVLLGGTLPYLEMPSTGSDTYKRSGRGYTIGRFKGPSFAYFETEYRFPISANRLINGVCFFNLQSVSDGTGRNFFQSFNRAGGAGLRILMQKAARTTLCIDYARGQYGSSGVFFGLNEVF